MKATGPPPVGYCVAAPDDGAEGIPPGPEVIAILPLSLDPRGFPCQPAHKALSAEGLAFFLALDHLLNLLFDHLLNLLFAELATGILLPIGYHNHHNLGRAICLAEFAEALF